jgi:cold-inducible RNA-binding protein
MGLKLYVGNMAYSTTEAEIRELFSQAGEVASVSLITDRDTGRPKGFGFVEMTTEEGSSEAIKRFNGYTLKDRTLTVNEARPREERGGGGDRGGYGGNRGSGGGNRDRDRGGYGGNRNRF